MAKYPNFLKPGDEIRIISPAGHIDSALLDGAKSQLVGWGYCPSEGMFTRGVYGRFSGTDQERYTDLQQALDDPGVKAVLCSRGGYGLARIIDRIDFTKFKESPKWVIGFSDITLLHQAILHTGIISIHGGMAKQLADMPSHAQPLELLRGIFQGDIPAYKVAAHPNNRPGRGKGKLVGGNLAVLMGLRATPLDAPYAGSVLLLEDVGEKPYQIDRMLQNLRMGGVLSRLSGLIVGQFTDTEEDPDMHATICELIADAVKGYDYPVCFNFSAGHINDNYPLLIGATVQLDVSESGSDITFQSAFWKKAKDFLMK